MRSRPAAAPLALLALLVAGLGFAPAQDPPPIAPPVVVDSPQGRLDRAAADHKQADSDAAAVVGIQAQLAAAQATAAASAARATTDDIAVGAGLTALGRPVVQRQPDGSYLILTPTPTGYRAEPALDASAAIPVVPNPASP